MVGLPATLPRPLLERAFPVADTQTWNALVHEYHLCIVSLLTAATENAPFPSVTPSLTFIFRGIGVKNGNTTSVLN